MDVISAASSVVQLLDSAVKLAHFLYDTYQSSKQQEELRKKLETLSDLLKILEDRRKDALADPSRDWYRGLFAVIRHDGLLSRIKRTLDNIKVELAYKDGWRKVQSKLTWHWKKGSFEDAVNDIDFYAAQIGLLLNQDSFDLSKGIKGVADDINRRAHNISKNTAQLTKLVEVLQNDSQEVKAQGVRTEGKVDGLMIDSQDMLNRMRRMELAQEQERMEAERQKLIQQRLDIAQWLSPLKSIARQEEIFGHAFPVGSWLIDSHVFKYWTKGQPWQLRYHGDPGSGKTVLASIIINQLKKETENDVTPVLCLFLDYKEARVHTPENLLGSLIKQMMQLQPEDLPVSSDLRNLYEQSKRTEARPVMRDLKKIFRGMLSDPSFTRAYIVVDALDEASSKSRHFVEQELQKLGRMSLLITTREWLGGSSKEVECDFCHTEDLDIYFHCNDGCNEGEFDICLDCKEKGLTCHNKLHVLTEQYDRIEIRVETPQHDIEAYVKEEVTGAIAANGGTHDSRLFSSNAGLTFFAKKLQQEGENELRQRVITEVVTRSAGKFLIAKLFMDSLKTKKTTKAIKETLDTFPTELDDIYTQALDRLHTSKNENRVIAFQILAHVVAAERHLTMEELLSVLSINEDRDDVDEDLDYEEEDILSMTTGLIMVERGTHTVVKAVHLTLQHYLERDGERWFGDMNGTMAYDCITFLQFDAFSTTFESEADFEKRRRQYPFITYAAQFWGDHLRLTRSGMTEELGLEVLSVIGDPTRVTMVLQILWYAYLAAGVVLDVRRGLEALHICAWFGLRSVAALIEDPEVDVLEPTMGQTPLLYACRAGHADMVAYLLKLGANPNVISKKGTTPLLEAVNSQSVESVQLLLAQSNINVNSAPDKKAGETALMHAAHIGNIDIIEMLLNHPGIDVNLQNKNGSSALSYAVARGHEIIVQHLLGRPGIDIEKVDRANGSHVPLTIAAKNDYGRIMQLLLKKGADPNTSDLQGGTPLIRAIDNNAADAVSTLLTGLYDVNIRCVDKANRGVLHAAAISGRSKLIPSLLRAEPELSLDATDDDHFTPLHDACRNGHLATAEVLLGRGSTLKKDKFERSPLLIAWQYGHLKLRDLLKDRDDTDTTELDLIAKGTSYLPLWSQIKLEIPLEALAESVTSGKCAITDTEPASLDTALHWAVRSSQPILLSWLLRQGLSPNLQNTQGRTAMHTAAFTGSLECAKILLTANADTKIHDVFGSTPMNIAVSKGRYDFVVALISAGASASKLPAQKEVFFAAVELGDTTAARKLLDESEAPLVLERDGEGRTARQLAKKAGDGEMIRLLDAAPSVAVTETNGEISGEGDAEPRMLMRGRLLRMPTVPADEPFVQPNAVASPPIASV